MDYFSALKRQIASLIAACMIFTFSIGLGLFVLIDFFKVGILGSIIISVATVFVLSIITGLLLSAAVLKPFHVVWLAITHLSDKAQSGPAPQADQLKMGRTLVTNLLLQLYQLASTGNDTANEDSSGARRQSVIQSANIVSHMPLPLFVFNKDLLVTNASNNGLQYCALESSELFGKALNDSINLEFPSDRTLESWIEDCKQNKVTDTAYWERVRVVLPTGDVKYRRCDMAAYYNRDNPSGTEFIVTMFDRTEQYQQDDNSMSFVALAVHELRTPLTLLRGYIEIFVDELDGTLSDEMKGFLRKMDMSAKQLNAFVGNILNVSKVDENALTLHLEKANWETTLTEIIEELKPKAAVHDMQIDLQIASDLPEVGIDMISITEVVSNLIDNAIKYSPGKKQILVRSQIGNDGSVETTVQDFGVGIPEGVVPHIFEKFYRNHRTKAQIGGTGLGLYLSKSLVNAHGGQIWVSSKPDEGSTFGFTLQPFNDIDQNQNEDGLTRTAHGWIKNHSMYRR